MIKYLSIAAVIALAFSACAQAPVKKQQTSQNAQMPEWVYQPTQDGINGAVGSAKTHFKGRAAQRSLAISRALDELAKQHGVNVHTASNSHQSSHGGMVGSQSDQYSFQTSDGIVTAHIEKVWLDPKTNELFVWMRDSK